MHDDFVTHVRERLLLLARQDSTCDRIFGASGHRYRLAPPLPEAEIAAFERRYRTRLPDDYRAFITLLGNGGAGPFYGLFPLGMMDDSFTIKSWTPGEFVGDLSQSFPHMNEWNLPDDQIAALTEGEVDPVESGYWGSVHGVLPVAHEGCALRDWLVVAGPEAGRIWHDATADFGGWVPWLRDDGQHMSFRDWYEAWLDDALWRVQRPNPESRPFHVRRICGFRPS